MPIIAVSRAAALTTVLGLTSLAVLDFFTGSPPPIIMPVASDYVPVNVEPTEQLIFRLFSAIGRSKKPLPVWALDAANKAITHWRLHRLSQKTAEVESNVARILRIVADIQDQADAGRTLSERETHWAREALQALGRHLDDLASRVATIEKVTGEVYTRIAKLETDNKELTEQNSALRRSNDDLARRILSDRCGVGRKRGAHGCTDIPR